MTQALIWLDEHGGQIWLKRYRRWITWQTFSWEGLEEAPLSLPAGSRVTILSALAGERLVFDGVLAGKRWLRTRTIAHKLAQHFTDTPYVGAMLQGPLNALQLKLCGIALPRERLDSLLYYLQLSQAVCQAIVPMSSILTRYALKKRAGVGLWIILHMQAHYYFIDKRGLCMSRVGHLPSSAALFTEEVKKIYRYALGQKWLVCGEELAVHYYDMSGALSVTSLLPVEFVRWQPEKAIPPVPALWQQTRHRITNCSPAGMQHIQRWRCWNRRAWYAAAGIWFGLFCSTVATGYMYYTLQQRQHQLASRIAHNPPQKLPVAAQTLLAIEQYWQSLAHPDYESMLVRLSQVQAAFPAWQPEQVEWQQRPHKMVLAGKWLTTAATMEHTRFERAMVRQLQARQIQVNTANTDSGQMVLEVWFDSVGEKG